MSASHHGVENLHLIHQGAVAEQLVGQELLAYQDCLLTPALYYWSRDVVGSQAEVDYVSTHENQIVPIEVKAGSTGALKSLHSLMQEKNLTLGIRISEKPFWRQSIRQKTILSIPFYLMSELLRLIHSV